MSIFGFTSPFAESRRLRTWFGLGFAGVLGAFGLPSGGTAAPAVDAKRIINDSAGFLKEREPEMTEEEHALYDKVSTMISVQPEFAIRLLEGMMAGTQQPSPAFDFIMGNAYYGANRFDEAEARYRRAVSRYPSFLRAWSNLGVLYYSRQKFPEAVETFGQSIALGDRDPATYGMMGYSLEKVGNPVAAEAAYLQAIAGAPANADWSEGLLRIYLSQEQYPRAESLVKAMVHDHPDVGRFWLDEAHILLATGRRVEAMAWLEQTIALHLAGPEETEALADLYAEHGLVPEAVGAYRALLADHRPLAEGKLIQYARSLGQERKWEEADRVLASLGPAGSPEQQVPLLIARAEIAMGEAKPGEARRIFREALAVAPLNGDALVGVGRASAALGDSSHAQLAFEAALQVPASAYLANIELANIELKRRHYDRSVAYLEKALALQRTAALENYLVQIRRLLPEKR